jgi:pimeloyl-ACP methyl ester carboxylesterase
MLQRPRSDNAQAVIEHYVHLFKVIGSPGFATPEVAMRERIALGLSRGYYPVGTLRQMLAVLADVDRAQQLARLSVPTLVVHGKADPLLPLAHGEDTARRIALAKLLAVEGMGHDLAPGVVDQLLSAWLPHLKTHDVPHVAT